MWRSAEGSQDIYLQLPRTIQPALQKRLTMFVLRAKAKLRDATEEAPTAAVLGLVGAKAGEALERHAGTLPDAPYGKIEGGFGTVIRLADAFGAPRYLWVTSSETAIAALPALRETLQLGGNAAWHLSGIHAGVPQVTPPTQEQFVPQMVNFELIGGVNFKKGCYPGQEIVARSQYLGKLKRRMLPAQVAATGVLPGTDVFASSDPDQPCGQIVNAEASGDRTLCLVELKTAVLEQGDDIRVGSASGPVLEIGTLPYELIDPT
jgi:folate-binding protein YgfZ